MRELLGAGAAVNARVERRQTPLHLALRNGHEAVGHALRRTGAGVNATDVDGRSPLHDASESGQVGVVLALLGSGAAAGAYTRPLFSST